MPRRPLATAAFAATLLKAAPSLAVDEIQVYDGEIAGMHQFTLQQHLNYGIRARRTPDYPGGLIPNHALNGTPEFAYGVTPWYEIGLYLPFTARDDRFYPGASSCGICSSAPMPRSGRCSTASTPSSPGSRAASRAASGSWSSVPFSARAPAAGSSSPT